jgi:sulfatase maturation enzyme AslB (radical SAM superfamily)
MSGCNQELPWKLWIYTNFDCNLSCTYCLANSTPRTPRLEISLATVQQLVDEAVELGFHCIYFTGGEPMLLDSLYDMLFYSAQRLPTTLLTNAMLVRGRRLDRLAAVHHPNLIVQVSLDGSCPETHDAYRGMGSWEKTIRGIRSLQQRGCMCAYPRLKRQPTSMTWRRSVLSTFRSGYPNRTTSCDRWPGAAPLRKAWKSAVRRCSRN